MRKWLVILLAFCCLAQHAGAQEEFIEPPSREITTIPFIQLTGGIIILQAKLDDFPDTLSFVLDTGSSGISLDSSTAKFFGLNPILTKQDIRGIAGIKKASFLYNRTLHFPRLTIDSLNFHINDYTILTQVYGERIDGIIGYAVFSKYILKVNYDSMQITFCTNGTFRYPRGGYLLKPTINQLVTQPLRIRDSKTIHSRFLYDMGAGLCMLLSRDFVDDSMFLDNRRKHYVKEGEGLGGKIDMELTVMKEVRVGPYRFRNVPILIFTDETNVTQYPQLGGILGNDLLRRFNVIVNYNKGDIYITPNRHYLENFDYSYSGMELYLVDGRIIAGDVAKGSPAELAGIKEGDEVVAVNSNFNQNLNQYKIALQQPDEKVKLVLRRNGELILLQFKVLSIY